MNQIHEICKICGRGFSTKGISTHIWRMHGDGIHHNPHKNYKGGKIAWNKGKTKETDGRVKKYANTLSDRIHNGTLYYGHPISNDTKEKLSIIRSKILEEKGVGGFKNIKWYKIKNILGEEFIVRGTWELEVARWLNFKNLVWVRKIYLSYTDDDNIKRTYCPDFYLLKYNLYIEVKGYFSQADRNKIKKVKIQNDIKLICLFEKHIRKIKKISSSSSTV